MRVFFALVLLLFPAMTQAQTLSPMTVGYIGFHFGTFCDDVSFADELINARQKSSAEESRLLREFESYKVCEKTFHFFTALAQARMFTAKGNFKEYVIKVAVCSKLAEGITFCFSKYMFSDVPVIR